GARRHDGSLLPNGSAKLSSPKDSDGTVPEEIDEGRKTPLCMEKHLTPLCPVGDGRSGRRRPRPDAVHQLRERFRERVDAVPLELLRDLVVIDAGLGQLVEQRKGIVDALLEGSP